MPAIILVLIFLMMCPALPAQAESRILKGEVVRIESDGKENPAAKIEVRIRPIGATTKTDADGVFMINLPKGFKAGESITIISLHKTWRIWEPVGGETRIPRNLTKDPIMVKLLERGSRKFFTDDQIEFQIAALSEKAKEQVKTGGKPEDIDFQPLIGEWAKHYGFSAHEVKANVDAWIQEVETNKDDFYKQGLAAYAKKHFGQAAALFSSDAERYAQQFEIQRKESEEARQKVIRGYRKSGDSYFSNYEFGQALNVYEQALVYSKKEEEPDLWVDVQMEIAGANWAIGIRTEGQKLHGHLNKAKQAYRAALEVRTREQLPQQWAATQNNLGTVLNDLGIRTWGAEGAQLLAEAVAAYRAALEVRTKESLAPQWAQTHNNLAKAAMALGDWEQVVMSFRNVLELYPDYHDAYLNTNSVLHEKLFRYEDVFSLNQQWLEGHPDDLSAHMNFAEVHLTTGRFSEAEQRFAEILKRSELDGQSTIPLRLLSVVSLVGQHTEDSAAEQLKEIGISLSSQPEDFTLGWSFEGTKYFIGQHEAFTKSRDWLVELLEGLSGKTRDEMLQAIEAAQSQLVPPPSP